MLTVVEMVLPPESKGPVLGPSPGAGLKAERQTSPLRVGSDFLAIDSATRCLLPFPRRTLFGLFAAGFPGGFFGPVGRGVTAELGAFGRMSQCSGIRRDS